jgi:hypothetical protein
MFSARAGGSDAMLIKISSAPTEYSKRKKCNNFHKLSLFNGKKVRGFCEEIAIIILPLMGELSNVLREKAFKTATGQIE